MTLGKSRAFFHILSNNAIYAILTEVFYNRMLFASAVQSFPISQEGGDSMNYVTYSDLFQFGLLIVAIITCCKKQG